MTTAATKKRQTIASAHQEALTALRSREQRAEHLYGVRTADQYVKSMLECHGDEVCRHHIYGADGGMAESNWDMMVKDAEERLTYSNEDMVVEETFTSSGTIKDFAKRHDIVVPLNTIMVFENVVTTPKMDRDRDILETKGAEPDPDMPFLWMHMPPMVCGKMLKVLKHTRNVLKVATGIAGTQLGENCAILVDYGAIRISHGFLPKEWHFLDEKDFEDDPDMRGVGMHFLKFVIMEESGVSVPSNTDAVITLVARKKLTHPLVKNWAQKYYDKRPLIVPTGFELAKAALKKDEDCCDDDSDVTVVKDVEPPDPASEIDTLTEASSLVMKLVSEGNKQALQTLGCLIQNVVTSIESVEKANRIKRFWGSCFGKR